MSITSESGFLYGESVYWARVGDEIARFPLATYGTHDKARAALRAWLVRHPARRVLTPDEAAQLAAEFGPGDTPHWAEWTDREGWYIQLADGRWWTQVRRSDAIFASEADCLAWLHAHLN